MVATWSHPIYVKGVGEVQVQSLKIGDILIDKDNNEIRIKEINKNHDISLLINNAGVGFYALHEELNPVKISGTCGRLMCCLKYEQEAYSDLLKKTPKIGAYVSTPDGKGTVVDQNLIKGILNVQLQKNPDSPPKSYKVNEVKLIKDGQIKINKNEQEELKGLEG